MAGVRTIASSEKITIFVYKVSPIDDHLVTNIFVFSVIYF